MAFSPTCDQFEFQNILNTIQNFLMLKNILKENKYIK